MERIALGPIRVIGDLGSQPPGKHFPASGRNSGAVGIAPFHGLGRIAVLAQTGPLDVSGIIEGIPLRRQSGNRLTPSACSTRLHPAAWDSWSATRAVNRASGCIRANSGSSPGAGSRRDNRPQHRPSQAKCG